MRLNLLDICEDAITRAEADDDLWDAQQEGLDPILHEFAVEVFYVAVVADLGCCFELDPVDGASFVLRLGVPYC